MQFTCLHYRYTQNTQPNEQTKANNPTTNQAHKLINKQARHLTTNQTNKQTRKQANNPTTKQTNKQTN